MPCSTRLLALQLVLVVLPAASAHLDLSTAPTLDAARNSILGDDVSADLARLASAPLGGRDSPSLGLTRAAQYIAERLEAAGVQPLHGSKGYLHSFQHRVIAPVPDSCELRANAQGRTLDFEYGRDYIPISRGDGKAAGPLLFAGFGIHAPKARYNDFRGQRLRDKVVMLLSGEPRHAKRFDGAEVTEHADVFAKLTELADRGAVGALIVRRPAPGSDLTAGQEPALDFRHTWAVWAGETPHLSLDELGITALEISPACASRLLGRDVLELAAALDAEAKPDSFDLEGTSVELRSATTRRTLPVDNVVGLIPGRDQELAEEYVVLGAHYDHVGVDPRGRIGFGADDNASGTAALLEVAQALARFPPRRSILICAFAAEEDGLVGSRAFCGDLPVGKAQIAAMLNMDMVGRGKSSEVAVLGTRRNKSLGKLLKKARKLSRTGITKVVTGKGEDLFQRSDHYSFHEIGVPALFFFEGLPITKNKDYHTWRDTLELVDLEKVTATARLVFNMAWLIAEDDDRPPPPGS